MYIVAVTPTQLNNGSVLTSTNYTFPTIEYYHDKPALVERLKKGGNIRVFEANELDFHIDVKLTSKPLTNTNYTRN